MELVELMEMAQVKLANRKGRALTQQDGSGSESWGGGGPGCSLGVPASSRSKQERTVSPLALWAAGRAPAEKMDDGFRPANIYKGSAIHEEKAI